MTTVKICGIKSADTLRGMAGLPVDHIGFVFAKSKRQVTPAEAGELIRVLREEGLQADGLFHTAGVFVNPGLDELERVLEEAPLDIIQLHGQEPPEFCAEVKARFGKELFKAVPIPEGESAVGAEQGEELTSRLEPYAGCVDAFLLDTYDPVTGGGSGRTFPWEAIPAVRDWARSRGLRLIIAGGLHADNVEELLRRYAPDGVDISSGVETEGVKDIGKIETFVGRVKPA
ncbi:phosphoribosylanthranilate isomerase [Gorillibacterium sp. sgz5001074]|uniref:phosphoribosylanthranilate isomerase n=1 Tax=Gorillibacterium sp. sgz5001074 TaxID=3446695 RepID=UPI003F66E9BB